MEAIILNESTQTISLPLKVFDENPDLYIGSFVQVNLNNENFALGKCVLVNPYEANFVKISQLCIPVTEKVNFIVKNIQKIVPQEADSLEIFAICDNIQTTLKLKQSSKNLILKLLNGLIIKNEFKINMKNNFLAQKYGIKEIIVHLREPNQVFMVTKTSKITSVKPITYQRYKKSKEIQLGGMNSQLKKLLEIIHRPNQSMFCSMIFKNILRHLLIFKLLPKFKKSWLYEF